MPDSPPQIPFWKALAIHLGAVVIAIGLPCIFAMIILLIICEAI